MVSEPLNPYVEWLGIPGGRQPTNHYELLGISLYENDPSVIAQAADGLIARLRRVRPGQQVVQWQQLLDELRTAKACLTVPAAKSAYDAELRRRTQSGSASPRPAPGYPSPSPQAPQLATPPGFGPSQPAAPISSPTPSPTNLAAQFLGQPPAVPYASPAAPMPQTPALGQPPPTAFTTVGLPTVPSASVPGQVPYASVPSPEPVPAAIPMAVPVASPAADLQPGFPRPEHEGVVLVRSEVRRPAPAKSSVFPLVARVVLIVVILVGAGLAFMLYQQRQQNTGAQATTKTGVKNGALAPTPSPKKPEPRREPKTSRKPKPVEKENPSVTPTPEPKPEQPEPKPEAKPPVVEAKPAPKPEPPLDPQKQRALSQALADARASLAESDLQAAQSFLATATKYVQNDDDQSQVERLKAIRSNLGEFWKTMSQIVRSLQATDEIPIRDDMIIVVEAGPDMLTIKAAGQVRQYTPLPQMPYLLVTTLADRRFGKDPQSKAIYASYLAVHPKGDRQRARQLWQEAIAEGVNVSFLLPELDQAGTGPAATSRQKSAPPSDRNTLRQTEEAIRARFRSEYEQATSPADKAQLAKKLLQAGQAAANNDLNGSFIMLREARDLAIAASEPKLVCEAIDELALSHAIDALAMKAVALEEVGKNIRGINSCKELVQITLPLIEEAVGSDRQSEASRLADVATSAAQKSKSPALVKQVRATTQELESLRKGAKPNGQKAE